MGPVKIVRVVVGIVTDGERLLIACRPAHVPLGGYWEFPGGKVEPGESPESAVERELLEELGLTVRPLARLPAIVHAYDHATIDLLPIICHVTQGRPEAVACDEWRWVRPEELSHYTFPPANTELLDSLCRMKLPVPPAV